MNILTKTSELLPDGSTDYLVQENGETIMCFNSSKSHHPILSRDAFYNNLVEYYRQRNIKFKEL